MLRYFMISHSKQKWREARKFCNALFATYPKTAQSLIDGVFVFGSVAANMATPNSDTP